MTMQRMNPTGNLVRLTLGPIARQGNLKKYSVLLQSKDNPENYYSGHVVSFLTLSDWCILNGMKAILNHDIEPKMAKCSERTKLYHV